MIELYTDGGCKPNPGIGSWAFIILKNDKEIYRLSGIGGKGVTNNQMEYLAIYNGLNYLLKNNIVDDDENDVSIISDSMLVIKQISGEYNINNVTLKEYCNKIFEIGKVLFKSKNIKLTWNSRESNWTKICDEMCDVEIKKYDA